MVAARKKFIVGRDAPLRIANFWAQWGEQFVFCASQGKGVLRSLKISYFSFRLPHRLCPKPWFFLTKVVILSPSFCWHSISVSGFWIAVIPVFEFQAPEQCKPKPQYPFPAGPNCLTFSNGSWTHRPVILIEDQFFSYGWGRKKIITKLSQEPSIYSNIFCQYVRYCGEPVFPAIVIVRRARNLPPSPLRAADVIPLDHQWGAPAGRTDHDLRQTRIPFPLCGHLIEKNQNEIFRTQNQDNMQNRYGNILCSYILRLKFYFKRIKILSVFSCFFQKEIKGFPSYTIYVVFFIFCWFRSPMPAPISPSPPTDRRGVLVLVIIFEPFWSDEFLKYMWQPTNGDCIFLRLYFWKQIDGRFFFPFLRSFFIPLPQILHFLLWVFISRIIGASCKGIVYLYQHMSSTVLPKCFREIYIFEILIRKKNTLEYSSNVFGK